MQFIFRNNLLKCDLYVYIFAIEFCLLESIILKIWVSLEINGEQFRKYHNPQIGELPACTWLTCKPHELLITKTSDAIIKTLIYSAFREQLQLKNEYAFQIKIVSLNYFEFQLTVYFHTESANTVIQTYMKDGEILHTLLKISTCVREHI